MCTLLSHGSINQTGSSISQHSVPGVFLVTVRLAVTGLNKVKLSIVSLLWKEPQRMCDHKIQPCVLLSKVERQLNAAKKSFLQAFAVTDILLLREENYI